MRCVSSHAPRLASARQRGLTLIELVVVLTILVALGGLLVPVVGNALSRSHVATCSANFPEVSKMLITAQATRGEFGDGWTTGVFGAGTGDGDPVNNSAANTAGGGQNPDNLLDNATPTLAVGTLTTAEVAALNEIGIETVFNHGDPTVDDYDVTFNPGLTSEALSTTTEVIVLTVDQAEGCNLPNDNGEKYIWLGIDRPWTFLGELTPEPPVHFGDAEGALPNQSYSRFGAIFKVGEGLTTNYAALPVAQFSRVSYCIDGDGFETGDNHVGVYWQEIH